MAKHTQAARAQPFSWAAFQSHVRYLPTAAQDKIRMAFELGTEVHGDQMRQSGEPYFSHPIAVANILADMHADADTITVALLHDALEDTPLSEDEIEERFGKTVYGMIQALTKLEAEDVEQQPTLNEQIESIRKLFTAMKEDVRIMVIKVVDRLHNMQTIQYLPEDKQLALAQETNDVYVKIADRLAMREVRDELTELCLTVLEPDILVQLLALRAANEKRALSIVGSMKKALLMTQSSLRIDPCYERNRFRNLRAQLKAGGSAVTGVTALTVVFVCEDIPRCYQTLGALHQTWRREVLSFEDFINAPMINGYRGLHTTVILEDGTRIRCKIRTREMDEYAQRGVTTLCFDSKAIGLPSYMSWGQRISPLSEDTLERSEEFWDSLQSDILGESITVHGMDDRALQLPEGSTALDAAFYFYGEKALKIAVIRIDGEEVPLHAELGNGVSLDVNFGKSSTVHRQWLQWVHTGLAVAKIREFLSQFPREKKITEGKRLLGYIMTERRKGLLAEFEEESMQQRMQILGYPSFNDGLIALAEGRVDPEEIYGAIFTPQLVSAKYGIGSDRTDRQLYVASFVVQKDNVATLMKLVDIYGLYREHFKSIRILPFAFSWLLRFFVVASFTPQERESFSRDVESITFSKVTITDLRKFIWLYVALPLIVVLWGLDCVFGKKLILAGVHPFDLTLLRFAVLFLLSSSYLLCSLHSSEGGAQRKKLTPFHKDLLLSGFAIFATALCSYLAVQYISIMTYALCMNLGSMITFFVSEDVKRYHRSLLVFGLLFIVLPFFLLIQETGSFLSIGSLAGLGSGIGFALYSVASSRYQVEESVHSRYPVFVFYFSVVAFLLSLSMFVFSGQPFVLATSPLFWPSLAFVTFLTAIPYILYFELLKREGVKLISKYIPLLLLVVFGGEILLYSNWHLLLIPPVILAVLWALFYRERHQQISM
jgi:GTP diphosphokinase / guanosine-3',5'-bis(diphosphate) 3'-diphosphatase